MLTSEKSEDTYELLSNAHKYSKPMEDASELPSNTPPSSGLLSDGKPIYDLAVELFPICRSLTGNGVRETLRILGRHISGLTVHEVPTGTRCFDWTIPEEWNIRGASITDLSGRKVVDFSDSNLHVVGYSEPVDRQIPLAELDKHLYSRPEMPKAIPYVTSYYTKRWGFCLSQQVRDGLTQRNYRVIIDSEFSRGSLTYAEVLIPGESQTEILLSANICHPSLANNEISGPSVTTFLVKWLQSQRNLKYSYRIVFVPETIGAIAYLSKNYEVMRNRVEAGFVITCIGDTRCYSYLESRNGNTLADRVATHVLGHIAPDYQRYSFQDRGSDERQYCSPGIDLPVVSIMRSKYGTYPEYHTSLDDMSFISPSGLWGGYMALARCLQALEVDCIPKTRILCEPQLSHRGLYPSLSRVGCLGDTRKLLNLIAYADGRRNLLDIAELLGSPIWELSELVEVLVEHEILDRL